VIWLSRIALASILCTALLLGISAAAMYLDFQIKFGTQSVETAPVSASPFVVVALIATDTPSPTRTITPTRTPPPPTATSEPTYVGQASPVPGVYVVPEWTPSPANKGTVEAEMLPPCITVTPAQYGKQYCEWPE
jgi:hypothetical protein